MAVEDGPIGDRSAHLVKSPLTPEFNLFPEKELAIAHMRRAVSLAAISAHLNIQALTGGKPEEEELPKKEKNRREIIIDKGAYRAFMTDADKAPYRTYYEYGEGENEEDHNKLGEAMPFPIDMHGNGHHIVSAVTDMVEGTGFATHNWPNAVSIVGLTTHNGIIEIPRLDSTGKMATYMRKLFAPGEFQDVLSLDESTTANLEAIMKAGQIQAKNIKVVVMKRKCNTEIVQEAKDLGILDIEEIDRGDLLWGLRAMLSKPQNPIIMLGRGGAPEGAIKMIAARALNATGQIRIVEDKKDIVMRDTSRIWTPKEFVPGAPDHSMVIFSAITKNTHFDLNAVEPAEGEQNAYLVENVMVDSSGLHRLGKALVRYPLAA